MTEIEKVTAQRDRLKIALSDLIGAEDAKSLRGMEAAIRMVPAPDEDKRITINAIHALLEVLEP